MRIYPSFVRAALLADVDLAAVTVEGIMTTSAFDEAHDNLNDIATVGAADVLPGVGVSLTSTPVFAAATTTAVSEATALELTGVGTATPVALVLYVDTGVASTSLLIAHIDRRAGNSPVEFTNDNGTVRLWWPTGIWMRGS